MQAILRLPFLVILMGLGAIAMLIPSIHGWRIGDFEAMRVFGYSGILVFLLAAMVGVASVNYNPRYTVRSHLVALLMAFLGLPVFLALPIYFLTDGPSLFSLYFEMVSCLTTTGATLFPGAGDLGEAEHLWRALVGWMGGFLILISVTAILAPLNLGGFEVFAEKREAVARGITQIQAADASTRLVRWTVRLGPPYFAATILLALGILFSGERVFTAAILAMSTLSTSGITAGAGFETLDLSFFAEFMVFLFLFFAVSRSVLDFRRAGRSFSSVVLGREFRTVWTFLIIVTTVLFLRHLLGSLDQEGAGSLSQALGALWGDLFTTMSFLTTTGFQSSYWATAQEWSGQSSPVILLLGLSAMGGGVATTSGGIKLLRLFALYKHGQREVQKLIYPSSVIGAAGTSRYIRREGAWIAWMFFMLFAISTALVMLAMALFGHGLADSMAYAVAALATTGPMANAVLGEAYVSLGDGEKAILALAMVVGRLETLAIIALFNPEFWRA